METLQRIQKKRELTALAEKYGKSDATVAFLLISYNNSVNDPANELVHLYDIRDALKSRFGYWKKACTALGITQREWNRLGNIANDAPLKQGRHRGKNAEHLRDATGSELIDARNIAKNMIEGYFVYLENHENE